MVLGIRIYLSTIVFLVLGGALLRWQLIETPIYVDELLHFFVASAGSWREFVAAFRQHAHPPLIGLPVSLTLAFGAENYWIRAAAFIFGMANIGLMAICAHQIFKSKWITILATVFAAILPTMIKTSVECRAYSQTLFGILLGLWVSIHIMRTGSLRIRDHALVASLNLFAMFSHYGAIFPVVALYLTLLRFLSRRGVGEQRVRWIVISILYAATIVAVFAVFSWQYRGKVPVYKHMEIYRYMGSMYDVAGILKYIAYSIPNFFLKSMGGISSVVIVVGLIALLLPKQPREYSPLVRSVLLYCVLTFAFMWLTSLLGKYPFSPRRHGLFVYPAMILLSSVGIVSLCERYFKRWSVVVLSVVSVSLFTNAIFSDLRSPFQTEFDARTIVNRARDQGDGIVIVGMDMASVMMWSLYNGQSHRDFVDRPGPYQYAGLDLYFIHRRVDPRPHLSQCLEKAKGCWIVRMESFGIKDEPFGPYKNLKMAGWFDEGYFVAEYHTASI